MIDLKAIRHAAGLTQHEMIYRLVIAVDPEYKEPARRAGAGTGIDNFFPSLRDARHALTEYQNDHGLILTTLPWHGDRQRGRLLRDETIIGVWFIREMAL